MDVELPQKLVDLLFTPARYKVAYGGRGSAKSWGFARALLTKGRARKEKILCCREIQVSIRESVHALLKSQIEDLGLGDFYEVTNTSITGKNGTEFIFAGLKHNIDTIKSKEGITVAWVEEAHNVSKASWSKLIPTIRKEGSEIWVSFNPELEEDETYQRFIISPPTNARVAKLNWRDNPWFPSVLQQEMEDLKEKDFAAYLNVWEGECRQALEGAVFAEELQQASLDERITAAPHTQGKTVDQIWDLGHADGCAIWMTQQVGLQNRFIDYQYEHHKKIGWHLEHLQQRNYNFGTIWLPHDADFDLLGQEKTIKQQVQEAFPNADVRVIEAAGKPGSLATGINLAREMFPTCYFDKEKCADGLHALRHWHYAKDEQSGKTSMKPVHDWSSHGSMAFVYKAMAHQELSAPPKRKAPTATISWMA